MKEEEIKELVRYRLNQARDSLNDAKYLLDGKCSIQSIINRSYYAMFYAALALLQTIGKVPSKHTGVIGLFDTEFVVKEIFPKDLSEMFHRAFELRQSSDYRVLKLPSIETTIHLLEQASTFVKKVEEYLKNYQNKS